MRIDTSQVVEKEYYSITGLGGEKARSGCGLLKCNLRTIGNSWPSSCGSHYLRCEFDVCHQIPSILEMDSNSLGLYVFIGISRELQLSTRNCFPFFL